jgi:hypothetical protein
VQHRRHRTSRRLATGLVLVLLAGTVGMTTASGATARTATTTVSASLASTASLGYGLIPGVGGTRLGRVVRMHPALPVSTRWAMLGVMLRINAASGAGLVLGPDTTAAPASHEIVVRAPAVTACGAGASGCMTHNFATVNGVTVVSHALVEITPATTGTPYEVGMLLHETAHAMGLAHFDQTYLGETQVMAHGVLAGITDYRAGDRNGLRALASALSNPNVRGALDGAAVTSGGQLRMTGWALDLDTPLAALNVAVSVNGVTVAAGLANRHRPDVGAFYPAAGSAHGYDLTAGPPADGTHLVCASATGHRGQAIGLGCRWITVQRSPIGNVDAARQHGPGTVRVAGWALDPDTAAPIGVHLYVNGRWGGALSADQPRPDVGAVFPAWGPNHGWSALVPLGAGTHQICAFGINVGAGSSNPLLGCRTVTVASGTPVGKLEAITRPSGGLGVQGWALDPDTTAPIPVHLYINGRWGGALVADQARPDIARLWPGFGEQHGFSTNLATLGPGTHTVCAYALNVGAGSINPSLGCLAVTVT